LQAKLVVGQANDPLEHEADRVADQVMRMPDRALAVLATPSQVSRKCAECEEEEEKGKNEENEKLQMKPASTPRTASVEAPPIVHDVLRGQGQPLNAETRAFFEPRFGCDFSSVRVHSDEHAAESARSIGASAYTTGSNVVFASGRYAPATSSGRLLLAHELTHVVQQQSQPAIIQRDADSDDYKQGYQDGLNGEDWHGAPRDGDALTDYNEGFAKGQYEFSQQTSSGEAPGETVQPPAAPAPVPATPASGDSTFQPPASGTTAESNPYAGTEFEDVWKQGFDDGFAQPDEDHPAPSPLTPDAQAVYSEGVMAGKDAALPHPSQSVGPPAPVCTPSSNCPTGFCTPLNWVIAQVGRADSFAEILAGIAAVVNGGPRVVPLWFQFIWGGNSTVQDISAQFASDFTNDDVTIRVTDFLLSALSSDLQANPPIFLPGESTKAIDIGPNKIGPETDSALAAIRRPGDQNAMEFAGNSIPGNIAGGIGTNEAACNAGANPSSQNDDRRVMGTVNITQFPNIGTLLIDPSISYTVDDTIDFCPGNCGTGLLTTRVTTTLSRWEATGISGDVPFTVNFPAPPRAPLVVTVTPSSP
jgi:hypothetical protein